MFFPIFLQLEKQFNVDKELHHKQKHTNSEHVFSQSHMHTHTHPHTHPHSEWGSKCRWEEMKAAVPLWFHLVCYIYLTLPCPLSYTHIDYSIPILIEGVTLRSKGILAVSFLKQQMQMVKKFTNIQITPGGWSVLPFPCSSGC
ncbi:hypothetical protein AMECASPLE_020309 [Ameca splendens]|uniref:Uncharacterized protein n=1 Tax=Ameca splendens TaxID=208324 RepID=A0ABV1A0Z1_9TELE